MTDATVLDASAIGQMILEMRVDDVDGGLYGPSDGFIDGHLYCSLLGELAEALGVRIHGRNKVIEVTDEPGGGHRVITERGTFSCDVIVNAAGAWGAHVAGLLGTGDAAGPAAP